MSMSYIILWVVIGAVAGWAGGRMMRGNVRYGTLMMIVFGILGTLGVGYLIHFLFGALENTDVIATVLVALMSIVGVISCSRRITESMQSPHN